MGGKTPLDDMALANPMVKAAAEKLLETWMASQTVGSIFYIPGDVTGTQQVVSGMMYELKVNGVPTTCMFEDVKAGTVAAETCARAGGAAKSVTVSGTVHAQPWLKEHAYQARITHSS